MDTTTVLSESSSLLSLQHERNNAPLHESIERALLADSELRAVHVKVQNLSCWYAQRAALGGRNHLTRQVTLNPKTLKWESRVYQLRRSTEDFTVGPQLVFLSTHSSKWQAYKHCEYIAQQRDLSPVQWGRTSVDTHFRVVVVSDQFRRKSCVERVALVHEALLRQMGEVPNSQSTNLADCAPGYVRGISVVGQAVANLEFLRYIRSSHQLQLVIEAKTPSQWNPAVYPPLESERAGPNHLQSTSLSMPEYLLPRAHRRRLKMLLATHGETAASPQKSIREPSAKLGDDGRRRVVRNIDLLGTVYVPGDATTADMSKDDYWARKAGGIYGHFFQDLPPDTKKLVLQQYAMQEQRATNKARTKLQAQLGVSDTVSERGAMKGDESFSRSLPSPKLKARHMTSIQQLQQQFDPHQAGCTEDEILEQYQMQSRIVENLAVRLQRIWRLRVYCRAVSTVWHRNYAVVTIQRVARGAIARAYAALLRALLPVAATKVQTAWRAHAARKRFLQWRAMVVRAVTKIQPLVRKFLVKCYAAWKARHEGAARQIQGLCRMFLARLCLSRLAGQAYQKRVIWPAAVTIQRVARGRQARRRAALALVEQLVLHVDVPAAISIQRVWRGILARMERDRRIVQIGASIQINKMARGYLARRWYQRVKVALVERDAAISIQRHWRGHLDRTIYWYRLREKHWHTKYLPAVVLVQSIARGNLVRQMVRRKRFESAKASVIQDAYRRMVLRRKAQARWMELRVLWRHRCATKIQTRFRIVLAKRALINKAIEVAGAQYRASRVIMRAWINFRDYRRFSELLFAWRVERYNSILDFLARTRLDAIADREEVVRDLQHTERLIANYKARIRELREFRLSVELRLPKIEEELDTMPVEDLDRGWSEALAAEFTKLTRQLSLSSEELHLRKLQLRQAKDEREQLQMELEEIDVELDSILQREVQLTELLRRMEIQEAERLATEHKSRKIRYEINRWKVDNVRKNIINRNSKTVQDLHRQIEQHRGLDYAMTISYKKKARQELKEQMLKKQLMQQYQQAREHDTIDYHALMGPIAETYDTVIHNTLHLLQQVTLDMRERGLCSSSKP